MPSFDITSEFDEHELANAIDQANREVTTRFDFKDSKAEFVFAKKDKKSTITLSAQNEFQLKQMLEILKSKFAKRQIDLGHMDIQKPELAYNKAEQSIHLKQGIESEKAKEIVKLIKAEKFKVQAAIQGEQVRVSGKKRDDLQEVIAFFREKNVGLPLQFGNFRD